MSEESKLPRAEAVWQACNLLAAEGKKPSVRSVRAHVPVGSDSDVQRDINRWFQNLLGTWTSRHKIAGVPDEVAAHLHQTYLFCVEQAEASLARRRRELDEEMATVRDEMEAVVEQGRLRESVLRERTAQVEQLEARLRDLGDVLRQVRSDLAAERQAHLAEKEALRKDAEEATSVLRTDNQRLDTENRRIEEQFRLMQSDLQNQIDQLRTKVAQKSDECDRLSTRSDETQARLDKALSGKASLESQLASALGRLDQAEREAARRAAAVPGEPRFKRRLKRQ